MYWHTLPAGMGLTGGLSVRFGEVEHPYDAEFGRHQVPGPENVLMRSPRMMRKHCRFSQLALGKRRVLIPNPRGGGQQHSMRSTFELAAKHASGTQAPIRQWRNKYRAGLRKITGRVLWTAILGHAFAA